jgi:hypothetical protein
MYAGVRPCRQCARLRNNTDPAASPLVVEVAVPDELADDGRAGDDVDVHYGQEVVEEADETACLGVFGHRVVDLQQQLHGVVLEKG